MLLFCTVLQKYTCSAESKRTVGFEAHICGELLDHRGCEGQVGYYWLIGFQPVSQRGHEGILQLAARGRRAGGVRMPARRLTCCPQLHTRIHSDEIQGHTDSAIPLDTHQHLFMQKRKQRHQPTSGEFCRQQIRRQTNTLH